MKGGGLSVMPIGTGVKDDLEVLWALFRDHPEPGHELRFKESFKPHFLNRRMSLIYAGRPHEAELREFEEKVLSLTLQYIEPTIDGESSQQRTIFGVYLMYSLYMCQPTEYRMRIRVTPDQFRKIIEIKNYNLQDGQIDVAYCILRMIAEKCFDIVCFPTEHNPLTHKHYERSEEMHTCANAANDVVNADNAFDHILADEAMVRGADMTFNQYDSRKKRVANGRFYPELNHCTSSYTTIIKKVAAECSNKIDQKLGKAMPTASVHSEMTDFVDKASIIKDRRAAIREKAYGTVAKQARHRRHRQESSGGHTTDFQSPSPKKQATYNSPAKNRIVSEFDEVEEKTPEKTPRKKRVSNEERKEKKKEKKGKSKGKEGEEVSMEKKREKRGDSKLKEGEGVSEEKKLTKSRKKRSKSKTAEADSCKDGSKEPTPKKVLKVEEKAKKRKEREPKESQPKPAKTPKTPKPAGRPRLKADL